MAASVFHLCCSFHSTPSLHSRREIGAMGLRAALQQVRGALLRGAQRAEEGHRLHLSCDLALQACTACKTHLQGYYNTRVPQSPPGGPSRRVPLRGTVPGVPPISGKPEQSSLPVRHLPLARKTWRASTRPPVAHLVAVGEHLRFPVTASTTTLWLGAPGAGEQRQLRGAGPNKAGIPSPLRASCFPSLPTP